MSKHGTTYRKTTPTMAEFDVSDQAAICDAKGPLLLKDAHLNVIRKLPLPGIVIFVHGVNSDGEWYDQTEEGLCQGLNDRLKRNDAQMTYPYPEGGQLTRVRYKPELSPDGYIDPDRQADNFITAEGHFSPVIRFRWGYKASSDELQKYGSGIYLNEGNYWGGGPFANGCTSLPDLWNEGLSQELFLCWEIAHFNPVSDRPVYSCPPRPYFVLAALRLAKLIESIRTLQADTPITIVCHSQGNMVAMAAAFLGDRMPEVVDEKGIAGRCVADTYVLCNPPYSLQKADFIDNWSESHMKDRNGGTGRQTAEARIQTLRNFFDIIRKPGCSKPQEAEEINKAMENKNHQFDAATDREAYGYGMPKRTCGRVTLYCNPHDQVISGTTIRGIGWLGMSASEIDQTNAHSVFCQRVFAQNFEVGGANSQYRYWQDHYRTVSQGSEDFWMPRSPVVGYSLSNYRNNGFFGTIITYLTAPIFFTVTKFAGKAVNAVPPKNWTIPLNAPQLPEKFKPEGPKVAGKSTPFDQGREASGEARAQGLNRDANDPYARDRTLHQRANEPARPATDAGTADIHSEAQLRYEHHGRLRMEARQEGLVAKDAKQVTAEDDLSTASDQYRQWRGKKIAEYLAKGVDRNATDHSTIMTDPENARRALAYDVAIGTCNIDRAKINNFRKFADWSLYKGDKKENSLERFSEYFTTGSLDEISVLEWATTADGEATMPNLIVDHRERQLRDRT